VTPSIHLSSTFLWGDLNKSGPKYLYTRIANPTREMLEKALAEIEYGKYGLVCNSGMSAFTTVILTFVKSGEHIVICDDVYGGMNKWMNSIAKSLNIESTFVDFTNPENVEKAI